VCGCREKVEVEGKSKGRQQGTVETRGNPEILNFRVVKETKNPNIECYAKQ
jgi:hypothetical protein